MAGGLTRREALACAAAAFLGAGAGPAVRRRMGLVSYCYALRRAADPKARLGDPLRFLEHCRSVGAGGAQVPLGVRDEAYAAKVRAYLDRHGMYLEGIVALPRGKDDVPRFEREVRSAKACGATVVRTVALNGRRYEVFATAGAFRAFAERSRRSLLLARPVVEKCGVRLAVENHKDFRTGELIDLLKKVGSEHVGVCLDTGNNVALLEDPLEVVKALAPYAFSTHVKDPAVREYPDGFLLAEVPLGAGFLDLPKAIETLRRARPEIHFNLEMLTRDPLKVPCLTRKYWATLDGVSGRELAEALARVRKHAWKAPLPAVSGLTPAERVKREDENVRASLRYARERLGL
jgi:3-oxoisoapionate decarboxylase